MTNRQPPPTNARTAWLSALVAIWIVAGLALHVAVERSTHSAGTANIVTFAYALIMSVVHGLWLRRIRARRSQRTRRR